MASWKKVIVSGSNAELAQITASGLDATRVVFTGTGGALTGSGGLTYTHSTETLSATKIVNDSAVDSSHLTGSFSGSFRGEYLNSDGSALETEWDGTRNGDAEITGSLIVSASEAQGGGGITATGIITGSELGASNLGNTRVIFATTNGVLTSDAEMTYSATTDKLSVSHVNSTSLTASAGIKSTNLTSNNQILIVGTDGLIDSSGSLKLGDAGKRIEIGIAETSNYTAISGSASSTGSFGKLVGDIDVSQIQGTITAEWDGSRNGNAEITGSLIISASEDQGGGQLNVTGTVSGSALGASNLGNTRVIFAGANGTLTSDSNFKFTTSTDKLEAPHVSSTSLTASSGILADGFDVLTTQDITIFTNVGDSVLEIGAATTTVNIPGDLIELGNGVGDIVDIKGDLRVAGTSSFNHSTNLSVADKYILLNSGSSGANSDSGGIVIQGPNQNVGQLFGFVSGSSINGTGLNRRWGIANNFNAETSGDFTADAFMATVAVDTADSNPLATAYDIYAKPGNIYSGNDGEIYIYAQ